MKKLIFTSLFIIAIVILSTQVFADMGAPEIKPYTASVNKIDGATFYKFNYDSTLEKSIAIESGTLDYGTEFTISYEEIFEGIPYGYFILETENEENAFFYIKL